MSNQPSSEGLVDLQDRLTAKVSSSSTSDVSGFPGLGEDFSSAILIEEDMVHPTMREASTVRFHGASQLFVDQLGDSVDILI